MRGVDGEKLRAGAMLRAGATLRDDGAKLGDVDGDTRMRDGALLRGRLGDGALLRALDQVDEEAGGRRTDSRGTKGRGSAGYRGAALLRDRASGVKRCRLVISEVLVMRLELGPDKRIALAG